MSGNVGVGTTTPAYTLDVNGNARVSGTINISDIISGGYTIPGKGYISSGFFYQSATLISGISAVYETKSVWSRSGLLLSITGQFILNSSSTNVSWGVLKSTLGLTGYSVNPIIIANASNTFTNMSISEDTSQLIFTANVPGTGTQYCNTRVIIALLGTIGGY